MRRVDPIHYTREYFLTDCTGYQEFKQSLGEELEIRLKQVIPYLVVKKGDRVLDVGCGRGEMINQVAKKGAKGVGIDYSKEAIKLCDEMKRNKASLIRKNMDFYVMDAKKLTFPSSSFDFIILTDVVEHLYPEELEIVFGELKRVLKVRGKIIMHTAPNRLFNDLTYKLYSYPLSTIFVGLWNVITGSAYSNIQKPDDIRTDSHRIMHVNEPTYFSLKKLFKRYGFSGFISSTNITVIKPIIGVKDVLFNFLIYLHPLSKKFPFNIFFGSDFISVLTNEDKKTI